MRHVLVVTPWVRGTAGRLSNWVVLSISRWVSLLLGLPLCHYLGLVVLIETNVTLVIR